MALKKVVPLLLVLFVGFYLLQDPDGLAQSTKDGTAAVWDGLTNLFDALIDFINAIKN